MTEYIKREAAISAFDFADADVIEDYGDGADFGFSRKNIRDVLQKVPAADAVPLSDLLNLRDWLYEHDAINMDGLAQLNQLLAKDKKEGTHDT